MIDLLIGLGVISMLWSISNKLGKMDAKLEGVIDITRDHEARLRKGNL